MPGLLRHSRRYYHIALYRAHLSDCAEIRRGRWPAGIDHLHRVLIIAPPRHVDAFAVREDSSRPRIVPGRGERVFASAEGVAGPGRPETNDNAGDIVLKSGAT